MPVIPITSLNQANLDAPGSYTTYRYFTTDLLTNEVLSEIPFRNVSWQRALKAAGEFSGRIEIIDTDPPETIYQIGEKSTKYSELIYNSTMPGKTGLYIMRDGVCVWGGIIWARKYDIVSRDLEVSASEFTSYFFHRVAWKTVQHSFTGTISTFGGGNCVVTLQDYDEYNTIRSGSSVRLQFRKIEDYQYDGYYNVTSILNPAPGGNGSQFTVTIPGLPAGDYAFTSVTLRSDTYDYVDYILKSTFLDYWTIPFQNEEIEPAIGTDNPVVSASRTGDTSEITTAGPHNLTVGQTVFVKNTDSDFNGSYLVSEIPGTFTFRAQSFANGNISTRNYSTTNLSVTNKSLDNYIAVLTTSAPHGFQVGDTVTVSNVDNPEESIGAFNGTVTVYETPSSNVFTYFTAFINEIASSSVSGGTVTKVPAAVISSYGSYPLASDLFINTEYFGQGGSLDDFSDSNAESVVLRGHELRTIGDELNEYSDILDGFEYRVDCDYNFEQAQFTRTLKFFPVKIDQIVTILPFPNVPAPPELFPGATDYIFEYPGSVDQFNMEESAEDAATRFWVGGNIPDLGSDISQPYAGAAAQDLISRGWPVLDAIESKNDISSEEELYSYAERYLKESRPPVTKMTLSVNGSLPPLVGTYSPGDWCSVIIDDVFFRERLQSVLEPRKDILVRKIESFKVSVPDMPTFPEKVDIELIPEWEVDTGYDD